MSEQESRMNGQAEEGEAPPDRCSTISPQRERRTCQKPM